MADSGALRARRSRLHAKGDHSLCDPQRCNDVTGAPGALPAPASSPPVALVRMPAELPVEPAERVPGGIETMARAFVDTLPYAKDDPRHLIGELAVLLAQRVDDDGAVPAAVRELRTLLVQLAEAPNGPAGTVDELRLRRAQRRLDGMLAQVR